MTVFPDFSVGPPASRCVHEKEAHFATADGVLMKIAKCVKCGAIWLAKEYSG
jgi:hypothetical protein